MKKINLLVIILSLLILSSITALSQLDPITNILTDKNQITPAITLEQDKICITSTEIREVYSNCTYHYNYTSCLNTSGANRDCSLKQDLWNITCRDSVAKNVTACTPKNDFIVSISNKNSVTRKKIDFSEWGPCIYKNESNCLIVTCQSKYDGANDGKFHGCSSGTTCQKFVICDNSIRTYYKNSREDFVEEDPTFYLPKLALEEVGE